MTAPLVGANGQPIASGFQYHHLHGKPSPCPSTLGNAIPLPSGMLFVSSGGLTCLEQASLETARALAHGFFQSAVVSDSNELADFAVKITLAVIERCRASEDPYQQIPAKEAGPEQQPEPEGIVIGAE